MEEASVELHITEHFCWRLYASTMRMRGSTAKALYKRIGK